MPSKSYVILRSASGERRMRVSKDAGPLCIHKPSTARQTPAACLALMTAPRRFTKLRCMESAAARQPAAEGVLDLRQPPRRAAPLVIASPHSGADYPEEFLSAARLDHLT